MKRLRNRRMLSDHARTATWEVVGALLRYPDAQWVQALPAIRREALDQAIPFAESIAALTVAWEDVPLADLQSEYVELFDLGRSCALDMSWHQFGDRRQRGLVLLNLVQTYQRHGFGPASGELPDWLPLMLEFAAEAPGDAGAQLLADWRTAIEVVRRELAALDAPELVLFDALSRSLGPADRSLAGTVERLLTDGPPGEDVGLAPFGPAVDFDQPMMPPASACATGGMS